MSIAFAVTWCFIGTLVCLKITDLAHGGFHLSWRMRAIRVPESTEAEGLDSALFNEQGYNQDPNAVRPRIAVVVLSLSSHHSHPPQVKLSVEVGPLRGRKGHGLQVLYPDAKTGEMRIVPMSPDDEQCALRSRARPRLHTRIVHLLMRASRRRHAILATKLAEEGGLIDLLMGGGGRTVVGTPRGVLVAESVSVHGGNASGMGSIS